MLKKLTIRFLVKLILIITILYILFYSILVLFTLKAFYDIDKLQESEFVPQTTYVDMPVVENTLIHIDTIDIGVKDISILFKITEAEATAGTLEQKENVVQCILNRVASENFPNTIKGVVYQDNQFYPLYDRRYYKVKVTKSTVKAVENIINSPNKHDGLFFMVRKASSYNNIQWFDSKLDYLFNDDMHEYFN